MSKVPKWKVDYVKNLASEINNSPVTALVSIKGIRTKQLQGIRRALKGKATIRVLRGTLLEKSIEKVKLPNIKNLEPFINGQIALITTELSPVSLYSTLHDSRQKAAARGGEIAPEDIIVAAKETNFPPGPMISEFQKVGLQTAIEKGKIVIKKEAVFVKKGEKISRDKAKIMEKLEIFPLDIGLDVISAYEDGVIFNKEAMSLTPAAVMSMIATAFAGAKAVAKSATFMVKEIIPDMIVKARMEAESLAIASNFVEEGNIDIIFMNSTQVNEVAEEKETKEEAKSEEPKEEDVGEGFGALFG
ncbi:MAG: 50S ribosomal protein L10 [Candidatus Thermoplasmatota archaeon]|jgi:large subunit ribosomal protein L10|nr:50S ribosomal protein L10 [Candidatus Thermoplasmatota archaeon]MCL5988414.1 50S ribosomal protein L10 [Candidatus Thermoplasmatota archaeon]